MSLSREVAEFAQAFSTVSNAASRANYYNERAAAAGKPKPKSVDPLEEEAEGIRAGVEAMPLPVPRTRAAIPTDTAAPTSGGGAFGVPDNLWGAQTNQESGGKQFGVDGVPLTSSAGAVGIAQVMPGTAPEAAQLAGVPYDENRYRTDRNYNEALGRAYMGKQLQDFGDQSQSLAAYNAGPQRVRDAVSRYGEAWLSNMPPETRDYVARITGRLRPRVAAFAAGGLVEDDSDTTEPDADTDDMPSAIPVSAAQPAATEQPQQPAFDPSQLVSGVGSALQSGMQYIMQTFGLGEATAGAIPGGQAQADGLRRFAAGEGAASDDDVRAIESSVDPRGELEQGLRRARGLDAIFNFYVQKNRPDLAARTAASMLLHGRTMAAKYGDDALRYFQTGDLHGAAQTVVRGYEEVPDGRKLSASVNPDGTTDMVQHDAAGRAVSKFRATPQQLYQAALGLKSGDLYWRTLIDAAGPSGEALGGNKDAGNEAYARSVGAVYSDQPQAQPQQAISTEPAQGVTPGGNAVAGQPQAQQEAIPTGPAPVGMPTPEDLAAMNPQQRANILAIRGQEMGARKSAFAAQQHEKDVERRHREVIDAEDRREARKQSAIPTPESRKQAAEAIGGAVDQFEATLPEGTTLATADKRAVTTAATHLFSSNPLSPDEAVDAALDLTDPNNPALDKATGDTIALRNGVNITLDPQSRAVLKTLRAKKLKDVETGKAAEESSWKKRAGRAVSTMAENAALPQAAKAYGELVPGMMEWAQQAWDAYQKSKPSRTVSLDSK